MKLLNFLANFSPKIIFIALLLLTLSCRKDDEHDKVFNDKYALEIERIKAARVEPKDKKLSNIKMEFTAQIEQDYSRYTNSNVTVPEYYSTLQFANQTNPPIGFQFAGEMFENNYNPTIRSPFRKIGAEFDVINIPSQDAYGIKSSMSDKEYLLVSRKLLQQNVDNINKQRSEYDAKNSQTLIAEQQKLKRKARMIKIFGHESVAVEDDAKVSLEGKSDEAMDQKKNDKNNSDSKKSADKKPNAISNSVSQVTQKNNPTAAPAVPVSPIQNQAPNNGLSSNNP